MKKRTHRSSLILGALALALAVMITGCGGNPSGSTERTEASGLNTENAVALVNGETISIDRFNIYYKLYEAFYKKGEGAQVLEQEYDGVPYAHILKDEILKMLVDELVIQQHMKESGYIVDAGTLDEKFEQLKTAIANDAETKAFYESIGLDDAFLKDQVSSKLSLDAFKTEVADQLKGDTERLEALYETETVKVQARHILVKEEAQAQEIKNKLIEGADFAELAKAHSLDPGTAETGGELEYFPRGIMDPAFEEACFSLSVGEISDPIRSAYGYHIIEVEDQKTVNALMAEGEAEEMVNTYKNGILNRLLPEAYVAAVEALRSKAEVETFIEKVISTTEPKNEDTTETTHAK